MTLVLDQIIQSDHFIGFWPMNTLVGPRKSHSGGNIKAVGEEAVKEGIYETAEGEHWARACVNPLLGTPLLHQTRFKLHLRQLPPHHRSCAQLPDIRKGAC